MTCTAGAVISVTLNPDTVLTHGSYQAISPTNSLYGHSTSFHHGLGLHSLSSQGLQQNMNSVANEIHFAHVCAKKEVEL